MNLLVKQLLDRPIAYHRIFVDVSGSVNAAVMLSQAFYWINRGSDPDGWFYKSQSEWEAETGLSRREQETARKLLKRTDFWMEKLKGVPATLHYNIDIPGLYSRMALSANLVRRFDPNKNAQISQSLFVTENTTENKGTRSIDPLGKEIIEMFNQIRRSFGRKSDVKITYGRAKIIAERMKEGYSKKEVIAMIQHRFHCWNDDRKMCDYLTIETMFRPSNFHKYVEAMKSEPIKDWTERSTVGPGKINDAHSAW